MAAFTLAGNLNLYLTCPYSYDKLLSVQSVRGKNERMETNMEKNERIEFRVNAEQKRQFEKMAAALGLSLSAFIIGAASEKLVDLLGQQKLKGF